MRKIVLLLVFSLIFYVNIFPQANRISFGLNKPINFLDSVSVFVGEHSEIMDKLSDWSTNFGDITYTLGVYSEIIENVNGSVAFERYNGGFEYYRGKLTYSNLQGLTIKSNVEPGVNPGDYNIEISSELNSSGIYYFVGVIKGKSERGGYFEDAGYWVVNCAPRSLTELTHDINLKNSYYFGESVYLDFSLQGEGMDKLSNYYFRIFENNTQIYSGLGSYINLGVITKNTAMVNRTFRIEGYYGGKIANFFNPAIPGVDSTVWNFTLLPPQNFDISSKWMQEEYYNNLAESDVVDAIDMSVQENRKIKFMYYSPIEMGAIVTSPELKNITVTSTPPDFLSTSNKFRAYDDGIWKVIELNVNSRFLSNISYNATKKITLKVRFTTQFGDRKNLTFIGFVF